MVQASALQGRLPQDALLREGANAHHRVEVSALVGLFAQRRDDGVELSLRGGLLGFVEEAQEEQFGLGLLRS